MLHIDSFLHECLSSLSRSMMQCFDHFDMFSPDRLGVRYDGGNTEHGKVIAGIFQFLTAAEPF